MASNESDPFLLCQDYWRTTEKCPIHHFLQHPFLQACTDELALSVLQVLHKNNPDHLRRLSLLDCRCGNIFSDLLKQDKWECLQFLLDQGAILPRMHRGHFRPESIPLWLLVIESVDNPVAIKWVVQTAIAQKQEIDLQAIFTRLIDEGMLESLKLFTEALLQLPVGFSPLKYVVEMAAQTCAPEGELVQYLIDHYASAQELPHLLESIDKKRESLKTVLMGSLAQPTDHRDVWACDISQSIQDLEDISHLIRTHPRRLIRRDIAILALKNRPGFYSALGHVWYELFQVLGIPGPVSIVLPSQ